MTSIQQAIDQAIEHMEKSWLDEKGRQALSALRQARQELQQPEVTPEEEEAWRDLEARQ